jgi:hypothetical protein
MTYTIVRGRNRLEVQKNAKNNKNRRKSIHTMQKEGVKVNISVIFTEAEMEAIERRKQGDKTDKTGIYSNRTRPKLLEILNIWLPQKKQITKLLEQKKKNNKKGDKIENKTNKHTHVYSVVRRNNNNHNRSNNNRIHNRHYNTSCEESTQQ